MDLGIKFKIFKKHLAMTTQLACSTAAVGHVA
jgi:hypothetical protein